jgi:hypothetical protein
MSRVITSGDVEAAARSGRDLVVDGTTLLTPLARDRAQALGVRIEEMQASGPTPEGGVQVPRLVLESKVRVVARRLLLRSGASPAQLEEVVVAVMRRLDGECGCR